VKLAPRSRQVLREIGALGRELAVLAAIDDGAYPNAPSESRLDVLQYLRIRISCVAASIASK
jgi:hypothetical protein